MDPRLSTWIARDRTRPGGTFAHAGTSLYRSSAERVGLIRTTVLGSIEASRRAHYAREALMEIRSSCPAWIVTPRSSYTASDRDVGARRILTPRRAEFDAHREVMGSWGSRVFDQ